MNYTLHQLQVFLKISQTNSITKAAEELNLTQPAVSIQLKNFQEQFDIPLTEVIGRKLYVTEFGKDIAHAAENILNEVQAINYKTLAFKGQLSGRLKVTVVSTGKYVIPYLLSDFLKINPGVELVLDVTNKAKVLESLGKNEVDFSLVSVLPDDMPIENERLMPNNLFLVSNKPMEETSTQPWSILETIPLIFREAGSGTRFVMESFIKEHKLNVRMKLELTSNEAVKQAVIAGLGCSIMPLIGLKNELHNGQLHIIPVRGLPLTSNWNLIWMRSKNFSPVANAFLEFVRTSKTGIINSHFAWCERFASKPY